ncbi:MAG: TIGR02270 family protein [Pirellulaceae bacterium]|nr:TIGR02270 family protein [Pirellulaceae bacterium]
MAAIAEIIDRHVEEAALLWIRRESAISQPHFRLRDLVHLDAGLEAHVDGLRAAELDSRGISWTVCQRELHWNEPGEVFPTAILAWESGEETHLQVLLQAASKSYECSRPLVSSLGWITEEQATPHIDRLLSHRKGFHRRIGIAACALRGRDPGEALNQAVKSSDKLLKARALRAIGELARRDLLPAAKESLRSRDLGCKFAAAWSLARLSDDSTAIEVLKRIVESQALGKEELRQPEYAEYAACFPRALQLVLRKMEAEASTKWLKKLAQNPKLVRQAVIGTGVVGAPDSIPWLLSLMSVPEFARVAGEALTMITGLDLAAKEFARNRPPGFESGPTEDPADENVALDEDENLPWPNPTKLAAWWERRRDDFVPQTRYLCGNPLTEEWLDDVLQHGYQRQRAAAALELAIRAPERPLFNVRAAGRRQQQLLGLK